MSQQATIEPIDDPELWFPAPPVCHAQWSRADWNRYIKQTSHRRVKEPARIVYKLHGRADEVWNKTDKRNKRGEALYRLERT